MDHQSVARALLAFFCTVQGIATAVIDLGRTHATHPLWLGHARFHVVWQTANVAALSALEVALVLMRGPWMTERFYLAAILAGVPIFGFFAALITRRLYGGTLSDPQGMPPWSVHLHGKQLRIDLNVVAEIMGVAALAVIVAIFRAT